MFRILAVTNMYPTSLVNQSGTFVEQQIQGLNQIGMEVEVIYVDRTKEGMGAYLNLRERLCSRIAVFKPDVVHAMYGGIMADIVTKTVENTPAVVSFCGSDLLGELLSGTIRKLIARYGIFASHRAARRAWGIVVKSKNLQEALPIDVNQAKVRIIPNGIDLEGFKPLDRDWCRERLHWQPDCFHVLFPTNGGDQCKRLGLAMEAMEVLNKSGIRAQLHKLQGVPHYEVPIWLNASDVQILTSLHEGSPNTIKEALACNIPIVSVDVGDVGERIQGVEGCYLSHPTPDDLASKLRLVHSGLGRVAGRCSVEGLSLESVALRLQDFYKEILGSYKNRMPIKF